MIPTKQSEQFHLPRFGGSSHRSFGQHARLRESSTVAKCERFLGELSLYRTIYEKLETKRKRDLRVQLLDVGKQVRCGTRTWARHDLDDIASWKGLPPSMLIMEKDSRDFEDNLAGALRIEDEPSRVSALCDIRGMGPILASTVSMFTWPDTYGFIDCHTYNALRFLGFEFPRKEYTSRLTINQLLMYLRIIRTLGGSKAVGSMEIAEALYALDNARMKDSWREEFKSSVSGSPTMVDAIDAF